MSIQLGEDQVTKPNRAIFWAQNFLNIKPFFMVTLIYCQAQAQPQPSWPGLALISLCTINFQILSLKSTRESMFLRHQALDFVQILN